MKMIFCEIKVARGRLFGYITGITAKSEPHSFVQDSTNVSFEFLEKNAV